jgi:hypothetical protein
METLKKVQRRICRVCPNQNMKEVLLLHDNALPHTSLHTREAIKNRTGCSSPSCSQPRSGTSDYHLFGSVKSILCGCWFADVNKLKQSFMMCYEVKAGNFTTMEHSILFNIAKSLLKMTQTLWKNSLTAKDV